MTIKHIRWVACIGLLAIICLQYVWLVNTYKLTKESIQFRSNEVFRDATMREVFYRMEVYQDSLQKKYKDKDTSIMVRINLDEDYDFFEDGRGDKNVNQWLMSNMQVSMQEIVKRDYKLSVSLSSLDSIYRTGLAAEGLDAEVITCVTDSLGNILRSSRSIQVGDYGLLKTGLQPINYKCTENLQAFIVNPYWVIFQQMTLLLIATVLMMAMIVYCLVYQIRIIAHQNKIARMREDFSYAMIHEMKTPLACILMGTRMLKSGKLDIFPDKREKHFQILEDESEHLLSLTNKVLTLSKLENAQLRLWKKEIQLRPMLEDLIEKYTAKADKPVHFSLHLESEWVYADEEFLKEAIGNLVDNSIKYSGEEVDIQISSLRQDYNGYLIKVRDNGIGIPLKDQSRIFEKYERASAADRSRKGGASGFGLGLNYVFRVAEAHGGKVCVESIEGEYSEFFLFLPSGEKKEIFFKEEDDMIKLLLVEDDANLCYIIRGGLEDMIGGYEVMTASNGEEGLKIWKEQHLDIIISDIEMPVMDGYEMVRRIRETDGFIPIVFTSGRVSPKDVVKGYELGVNNYIKKPFLAEELDAHIGALLKMKRGMGAANESEIYRIGENYTFDAVHAVLKHSSCVQKTMTEREAKLLQMLCKKKNELVRRDIILSRLWDTEDDFFASRSLDVFVTRLRKLFADDERIQIKTVKGVGLCLSDKG